MKQRLDAASVKHQGIAQLAYNVISIQEEEEEEKFTFFSFLLQVSALISPYLSNKTSALSCFCLPLSVYG